MRGDGWGVRRLALVGAILALGVWLPTKASTPVWAASPPHIMEIMDENTAYSSADGSPYIIGNPSAPYLNSLANTYASATSWYAVEHDSWRDYNIAISGNDYNSLGKKWPYPSGSTNATFVNELDNAGISWKSYMESMPSPCDVSSSAPYNAGHDPFVHFAAIVNRNNSTAYCNSHVVPYTQSGLTADLNSTSPPDFVWVTPNQCDSMHSMCSGNRVARGDSWLSTFIPNVMQTSWYTTGGIIIITWDESAGGDTSSGGLPGTTGGHIVTLVISSTSSGAFASPGNHYGTLRAIEEAYGVGLLGHSSSSAYGDLTPAFG